MGQRDALSPFKGSEPLSKDELQRLLDLIKTVKYGSITLIIQDGKLVQIDKNEKVRLK